MRGRPHLMLNRMRCLLPHRRINTSTARRADVSHQRLSPGGPDLCPIILDTPVCERVPCRVCVSLRCRPGSRTRAMRQLYDCPRDGESLGVYLLECNPGSTSAVEVSPFARSHRCAAAFVDVTETRVATPQAKGANAVVAKAHPRSTFSNETHRCHVWATADAPREISEVPGARLGRTRRGSASSLDEELTKCAT